MIETPKSLLQKDVLFGINYDWDAMKCLISSKGIWNIFHTLGSEHQSENLHAHCGFHLPN